MATTIQVHEETLSLLKKLRGMFGAKSYEQVIHRMARSELRPAGMGFGMLKGRATRKDLEKFLEEEHAE